MLAVYGSEGRLTAVDTDPENGLEGRLSSGYRFFENVYVQGRRTRLGGDVEWSPGRWQFTVEALRVRDERQEQGVDIDDLPAVVGTGASLTTRWRFAPRRDVAVRYEYLGFDDVGPDTEMASVRPRAADLRARAAQAVTFGGSWGVTRWVRLMGNAGVEWFSDPRTAPEAGRERCLLDARHASAGRTSRHPGIARPVSANAVTALSRPMDLDLLRGFDIAADRARSRRGPFNSASIASICSQQTPWSHCWRVCVRVTACCARVSRAGRATKTSISTLPIATLYHAHRCGRRPRYKVRIRHHVDRQLSFLEIKSKTNSGRTVKRRLALPYGQNHLGAPERQFIEAHAPVDGVRLMPCVSISFLRLTLVGKDLNERLTFDRDVTFAGGPREEHFSRVVIAEVKQAESFKPSRSGRGAQDTSRARGGLQ